MCSARQERRLLVLRFSISHSVGPHNLRSQKPKRRWAAAYDSDPIHETARPERQHFCMLSDPANPNLTVPLRLVAVQPIARIALHGSGGQPTAQERR